MTSLMQTMFVHHSPTQFPHSPRPLPALQCNVLAESESAIHFPTLASPDPAYSSPLQRHIQLQLSADGQEARPTHGLKSSFMDQQEYRGLGFNLAHAAQHADLLTRSNSNARNRPAFQPQRKPKGSTSAQLKQFAEATLGSGSLKKVVQLPEGEDRDEWIAVNICDFYNQINLLYGAITEFCSPTSCPEMKAGEEFEYLWHDPPAYPKPTKLAAPTYISQLLTWTSNYISDPNVFPTAPGVPFPADFEKTVRQIFKRLYRIYAHIYCHHYSVIRGLGLEPHLNTGFKHYVLFVEEFHLADEKGAKSGEWYGPLGELVESMLKSD